MMIRRLLHAPRNRWAAVTLAVFFFVFAVEMIVFSLFSAVPGLSGPLTHTPNVHAVAVLFHDFRDGIEGLSPESLRRLNHGISLLGESPASAFVTVGGRRYDGRTGGAVLMAEYARGAGVPEERIFTEPGSHDTATNLAGLTELMQRQGWTSVLLVSSSYHLARIRGTLRERIPPGVRLAPYSPEDCRPPLRAWDRWLSAHCNALAWTGQKLLSRSWYDGAVLWIRTHTDL